MTMPGGPLSVEWVGDAALLVTCGGDDSDATRTRVLGALAAMRSATIPGIADVVPASRTVMATLDLSLADPEAVLKRVHTALVVADSASTESPGLVEVPVCYGGEWGPDVHDVAAAHGAAEADIIAAHAAGTYRVRFIGFAPGFAYLDGLPSWLATPRLDTPRPQVAAGSVGIGGPYTGVYPSPTPGGWRIIGRTPLRMFDPGRTTPALLAPGAEVRFRAIDAHEFHAILDRMSP